MGVPNEATVGRGRSDPGSGVCLCIQFNHPFTKNIPLLRRIYGKRFSRLLFLVPFEQMDDEDVLTVYRGSFSHCAYANEHLDRLDALPCSHYIFTHDDVILSPWLNEDNILAEFGIEDAETGWIEDIGPVPPEVGDWGFQIGSAWRLLFSRNVLSGTGVDSLPTLLRYLPPLEEARARAAAYDVPPSMHLRLEADTFTAEHPTPFRFFEQDAAGSTGFLRHVAEALFEGGGPAEINIPYPIASSGPAADFYIVPHEALRRYCHYAATLATGGLFVEMAAPTALYLACRKVRTRREQGAKHIWAPSNIVPREALTKMMQDRQAASAHPIKLSQIHDLENFLNDLDPSGEKGAALARGDFETVVRTDYPEFEPAIYLALNADLAALEAPAFEHFYRFGIFERRPWQRAALKALLREMKAKGVKVRPST